MGTKKGRGKGKGKECLSMYIVSFEFFYERETWEHILQRQKGKYSSPSSSTMLACLKYVQCIPARKHGNEVQGWGNTVV